MITICFEKSVAVKAENVTNIFLSMNSKCCLTTKFVQQKYLPSSAFFPFPAECTGNPGKPGLQNNTTIKRKNGPESCYVPCNPARATITESKKLKKIFRTEKIRFFIFM